MHSAHNHFSYKFLTGRKLNIFMCILRFWYWFNLLVGGNFNINGLQVWKYWKLKKRENAFLRVFSNKALFQMEVLDFQKFQIFFKSANFFTKTAFISVCFDIWNIGIIHTSWHRKNTLFQYIYFFIFSKTFFLK
jgi:hypothetical protein